MRHGRRIDSRGVPVWIGLVAAVLAGAAAVAQEPELSGPVSLDQVGSAALLWRSERGLVPLPADDAVVRLSIRGFLVHGTLDQTFHNSTAETIEALYVFPLPERSAVHEMEMRIGARRIRAEVQEREQARRTFEVARDSGRKAALVEQQRPNLFQVAASNINPGETVVVHLEYVEELDYRDGRFSTTFPLTYMPRFDPGTGGGEADGGVPLLLPAGFVARSSPFAPRARIEIELAPGVPPATIRCTTHAIAVRQEADRFHIVTDPPEVVADRDFRLEWIPELGQAPRAASFLESRDGETYALVMALPPSEGSDAGRGLPTDTLFVVDVSGSMEGPSIAHARRALAAAIDRLRPEDRFSILRFSDRHSFDADRFRHAEPDAVAEAQVWIRSLRAGGGTMILPALMAAIRRIDGSRGNRVPRIVFLTDGAVSNEHQVLTSVGEALGETRLHALGIGFAPNRYLMRKMAELGRGHCEFIADPNTLHERVDRFFERLDRPVWTDLEIAWEGAQALDRFPETLPDLHAGVPLLFSTRIAPDGGPLVLTLRGRTRNGPIPVRVPLDPATGGEASGVALRWARAKVGWLMDGLFHGADPGDVRREVVDLALRFRLVTRYTSLIAVDDRPTALGPANARRLANGLPLGGSAGPLRMRVGAILLALGVLLLALRGFLRLESGA